MFAINIAIEFFSKQDEVVIIPEISVVEIDNIFLSVLTDYNIEKEWLKRTDIDNPEFDSLKYVYNLQIPSDLPIPIFLKDIYSGYWGKPVEIISEEVKNNGNSVLKIFSNEKLKMEIFLHLNKKISRRGGKFSFIVEGIEELSEEEFDGLVNSSIPFGLALLPSAKSISKISSILKNDKEYSVILNDDIDETKFKLDNSLRRELLRSNVRTIISSYQDAVMFLIDDNTRLYNSIVYNFIKDEFKGKGVSLSRRSKFIRLEAAEKKELFSLFNFHCNRLGKGDRQIFIVSYGNFIRLQEIIKGSKKRGHKYVPLSSIK